MPGGQTAATLTGTALAPAQLTVSPASKALGSVDWGGTGTDFPFLVSNAGDQDTGPLSVTFSGTMSGDFKPGTDGCSGNSLTKGASCTVYAHFAPGGAYRGAESATMTVSATPGGNAPVTLAGVALSPPQLSLSGPAVPQWTNVGVGTNGPPASFKVTNVGDQPSGTISWNLTTTTSPFWFPRPANPCTGALNPGASCTFTVNFTPQTAKGISTGPLTATATPGGTAQLTLEGTALWVLQVSIFAEFTNASTGGQCQSSGSATSSPAGINCAVPASNGSTNTCLAMFADQTNVTLYFNGGRLVPPPSGCTLTAGVFPPQCTFTMNSANPNPFVAVNYCGP
jgi:hypothetical protein